MSSGKCTRQQQRCGRFPSMPDTQQQGWEEGLVPHKPLPRQGVVARIEGWMQARPKVSCRCGKAEGQEGKGCGVMQAVRSSIILARSSSPLALLAPGWVPAATGRGQRRPHRRHSRRRDARHPAPVPTERGCPRTPPSHGTSPPAAASPSPSRERPSRSLPPQAAGPAAVGAGGGTHR